MHPNNLPIFPLIFFTITCGALSGFYATQKIFYGMIIAEGVIAMIWAAAAMSLFNGYGGLAELIAAGGPAAVVSKVSIMMLGTIGGTIAILGVIILPITSGDTAFRAARMIIADYFTIEQKAFGKRIAIAIPLFIISYMLTKMDFQVLWQYFSWANQVTAVIALWVGAMYLFLGHKNHWIATVPAIFMTDMVYLYIFFEPNMGFGIPMTIAHMMAVTATIVTVGAFFVSAHKKRGTSFTLDEDVSTFKGV